MKAGSAVTIRLWDWPVRLFHWLCVVLVAGLWASHAAGRMDLHIKLGMGLLFLVAFRLVCGIIGSEPARFSRFVKGPPAMLAYWRTGRAEHGGPVVGHNPLGALSVVGLLAVLSAQIGLGLFATDTDAANYGPLNFLVSFETAEKLTELHELGFNLILLLVAVHLAAIVFYAVKKKEQLVPPMITGRKTYQEYVAQPAMAPWWRVLVAAALALALCDYVWNGGQFKPKDRKSVV